MAYTNDYKDIIDAQNGNKEKMELLVKNNYGLVYSIVKRFLGRGYEEEDLKQIGIMGFLKAIKNFDVKFEVQLSTYSVPYIMGEIKRYIRDDGRIKVSRSLKELKTKIDLINNEYMQKHGKELKVEEISKILKVSKEDIIMAIDATSNKTVVSLNEPISNNDEQKASVEDVLISEKNEENEITNKLCIETLINELDIREKEIIVLRYFKGNTQSEIAKKIGISQVQISRIEKKVLANMRQKLA